MAGDPICPICHYVLPAHAQDCAAANPNNYHVLFDGQEVHPDAKFQEQMYPTQELLMNEHIIFVINTEHLIYHISGTHMVNHEDVVEIWNDNELIAVVTPNFVVYSHNQKT